MCSYRGVWICIFMSICVCLSMNRRVYARDPPKSIKVQMTVSECTCISMYVYT